MQLAVQPYTVCFMDQNEVFRRYLDLGSSLSQVTRERAEEIMRELVNLGDLRLEQAQQWVDDVLDRSRRNTEALLDLIREEVSRQLSSMSLVTKEDVSRLVTRLSRAPATVRKTAKKAGKKKTAKKAPARAKKAPARKAATKKAGTRKKATAKRATAKKATTKRAAAKRSTKKAGR
jgi:polyhydroxyalkanoate synthesis regulator phasin